MSNRLNRTLPASFVPFALLLTTLLTMASGSAKDLTPVTAVPQDDILPLDLRTNGFFSVEGRTLAPGVEYRRFHFRDLYGGPLSLCLVVVDWDKASLRAGLKYAGMFRHRTSSMARKAGAFVAVNGGYHYPRILLPPLPYFPLKIDGKLIKGAKPGGDGTIAFSGNELPCVGKFDEEFLKKYDNVLSADAIIIGGKSGLDPKIGGKAPHTGIGLTANRRLVIITIDGRHNESRGMNLGEMADFMIKLGCVSAINLDGGGSTTMYLSDAPGKGVVNRPSDGNRYDIVAGERKICDIFFLTPNPL